MVENEVRHGRDEKNLISSRGRHTPDRAEERPNLNQGIHFYFFGVGLCVVGCFRRVGLRPPATFPELLRLAFMNHLSGLVVS